MTTDDEDQHGDVDVNVDVGVVPKHDLRAKDVFAKSPEEIAQLDPLTQAELERWFARPSVQTIAAPIPDAEDVEFDQRQVRIAEACRAVEPWMVALLERHDHDPLGFRFIVAPPPLHDESILKIRIPSDDEIATIGEARALVRDDEIEAALATSAPQAILRDLYRPEGEFTIEFERVETGAGPTDGQREVREVFSQRALVLPPPVSIHAIGAEARRQFREYIAPPWADLVAIVKSQS
jgi:hypothetical protein